MSQRNSGYRRVPDDEYKSPPWLGRVIAAYLRGRCQFLWDPANGRHSKLAQSLRREGFSVLATNDDFLSQYSCLIRGSRVSSQIRPSVLAAVWPAHLSNTRSSSRRRSRCCCGSISIPPRRAPICSKTAPPSRGRLCCSIALCGSSAKARPDRLKITVGFYEPRSSRSADDLLRAEAESFSATSLKPSVAALRKRPITAEAPTNICYSAITKVAACFRWRKSGAPLCGGSSN